MESKCKRQSLANVMLGWPFSFMHFFEWTDEIIANALKRSTTDL